ncbi:LTV-domain-containing protein [Epithele typhae]|uniref:LTV-domain-containing protein n=1 Tax=Epithele typhae TaxID=378194 RepID=UPI0020086EDB|nr:LTV-domain-containing protein [Epithele typhae]KAH9943989.1 LTV-domain-containing protein [Epithele typhae]
MPPKSIFRQPGAQHFQVVHRSQRDPLIHDPEASKQVLKAVVRGNLAKGKSRTELEQLIAPADLVRDRQRPNIGEAAAYGVYYDDTEYDYMQHLKPVGMQEDGVDSIWLEAPETKSKGKAKAKDVSSLLRLPEDILPSKTELPRNYEAQQNIPSSISGFQPDMDPHLRQALEALEDDAFVDDDLEDDFFGELVADGERGEDDNVHFEFREDVCENDVGGAQSGRAEEGEDESWEVRFAKFKQERKTSHDGTEGSEFDEYSEGEDTVGTLPAMPVMGAKKRRRKGVSDASGYSMSSSSMWRNEHLTVLDERFDQIQRQYDSSDEEEEPSLDDLDEAPDLIASRADFESMMDEFLDNYEVIAGKMRPTLPGTATEKLDTVRKALGEAKLRDNDESDTEDDDILMPLDIDEKKDRWDCETILTTYSNLENHPRLIRARNDKPVPRIRLDPKTGLPSVDQERSTTVKVLSDSSATDEEDAKLARVTITRSKNETAEEKKSRKQTVKAERQARRTDKKATKERFSKEVKQQAQSLTQKEQAKLRKL